MDQDWLIDHTGIGVADLAVSRRFYTAVLAALGIEPLAYIARDKTAADASSTDLGGIAYGATYPVFWIDSFHVHSTKQHTAFRARSRAEVDAFHAAGLAAGGTDHGAPGLREGGSPPGYYAAFVRDPDGNNIEAVYRDPAA